MLKESKPKILQRKQDIPIATLRRHKHRRSDSLQQMSRSRSAVLQAHPSFFVPASTQFFTNAPYGWIHAGIILSVIILGLAHLQHTSRSLIAVFADCRDSTHPYLQFLYSTTIL